MEALQLLASAVGAVCFLGAFAAMAVAFVFYICMYSERRVPLAQWLFNGLWFLMDEHLSARGLVHRRRWWRALLVALGLGVAGAACVLLGPPGGLDAAYPGLLP